MIEKNEVLNICKNLSLRPETVEKDYVLGWMLDGISKHPVTSAWAFKGGTSLKKCFFDTFRFSEDLDFTLTDNSQLDTEILLTAFKEICEILYEETGIEFFPDQFKFKIIDKKNGNYSAQGKIHYNGPLQRTRSVASIKLDLTTDEILVLDTVKQEVFHPYSDEPEQGIYANCYAFEEVVAEKIRALAQRIRPRDLYDVVHFFRNRDMIKNPKLVYEVLQKKCALKDMEVPNYQFILEHDKLDELEPQWENMLAHQLPALPPMVSFWEQLKPFFDWLNGQLEVEQLTPADIVTGEVFQVTRQTYTGHDGSILNKIQFAAANRICIQLGFKNKLRTVEPLSFRASSTGNRLFYGFERNAGHVKAYTISKIQSVDLTNQAYIEKYPVEISPTGTIAMPPIKRATSSSSWLTSANPKHPYKIQCPYCRKTFQRKNRFDTKLNSHKNQHGTKCYGTIGQPTL